MYYILVCMCRYIHTKYRIFAYVQRDIVTNIYVCMVVMTFPCITSIRLQAANNFLLLTAEHNGIHS